MTTVLVLAAVVLSGRIAAAVGFGPSAEPAGAAATALVATVALSPAYAPRPMDPLERTKDCLVGLGLTVGALGLAGYVGAVAGDGYAGTAGGVAPHPAVLLFATALLLVVLPVTYGAVRRRLGERRAIVVGDDPVKLYAAARGLESTIGFVTPTTAALELPDDRAEDLLPDGGTPASDAEGEAPATDAEGEAPTSDEPGDQPDAPTPTVSVSRSGSAESDSDTDDPIRSEDVVLERQRDDADARAVPEAERIAGLSRLSHVLVERDVDAVALCFADADREEFFGSLRVCRELGVEVAVHASHAPLVLSPETGQTASEPTPTVAGAADPDAELVDVDLYPLSWHARLGKRCFDVAFAVAGLVALAPLLTVIAVAIKLDSQGPVLYAQRRTGRLGSTFELPKFRSMHVDAESDTGARLSEEDAGGTDPRVTRVGRVLRRTHLDEIPQLLSILRGDMSVVGPRPERPQFDRRIARQGVAWERRWFLEPGLTGLAQIHGVNGFDPAEKLAWDLAYRDRQSLATDVRIVLAQIRLVLGDVIEMLRGRAG